MIVWFLLSFLFLIVLLLFVMNRCRPVTYKRMANANYEEQDSLQFASIITEGTIPDKIRMQSLEVKGASNKYDYENGGTWVLYQPPHWNIPPPGVVAV